MFKRCFAVKYFTQDVYQDNVHADREIKDPKRDEEVPGDQVFQHPGKDRRAGGSPQVPYLDADWQLLERMLVYYKN